MKKAINIIGKLAAICIVGGIFQLHNLANTDKPTTEVEREVERCQIQFRAIQLAAGKAGGLTPTQLYDQCKGEPK